MNDIINKLLFVADVHSDEEEGEESSISLLCVSAVGEIRRLRNDIERYVGINAELATELAKLREQKPVAWRHENGNIFLPWQKDMIVTGAVFSPLFAAPLVPAVPKEWKQAVSEFLSSHDAAWAELFKSLPADTRSVTVSNHQADAVRKANVLRDLLQSAEVRHD